MMQTKVRYNVIITIIIIIAMAVSCHRPFLPGTSLEPAVNPTAHASSFTLLHIAVLSVLMCDVPSIPVFCSETV
jgi:hypothetical protein